MARGNGGLRRRWEEQAKILRSMAAQTKDLGARDYFTAAADEFEVFAATPFVPLMTLQQRFEAS